MNCGELKKPHIHIMFKVGENARHRKAIAKIIEIEPNYIQGCKKIPMMRYLIHLDNQEKTQYKIDEVQGFLKTELKNEKLKNINELVKYRAIIKAIEDNEIKNISTLLSWAINKNCIKEVKNMQYILTKIIQEKTEHAKH